MTGYQQALGGVVTDREEPSSREIEMLGWLKAAATQSLAQFRSNWLRTLLTLLGIVFGVGSVIAMGSIGEGAQRQILAAIEAMGADVAHVKAMPVDEAKVGDVINDSVGLCRADVIALRQVLPQARGIAYRASYDIRVTDLNVARHELRVFGVSEDFLPLHNLTISRGRVLLPVDHSQQRRVVVIGSELAARAFGNEDPIGKTIRLDYAYFRVVGVLQGDTRSSTGKEIVNSNNDSLPIDPRQYDLAVVLAFNTAEAELRPSKTYNEIDQISLRVQNTEQTLAAKQVIGPTLRSLHGGLDDFEVVAPEEVLQQRKKAQSVLNIVLISIAAISLLVGGIGVMNIMLANIMERVGEIGLRRAVGARRRDIRDQFLLEAVVICFVGGVIGIVVGLTISFGVALAVGLPIAVSGPSVALAFCISVIVGIVFGLMPALRAANINPIEALQHE